MIAAILLFIPKGFHTKAQGRASNPSPHFFIPKGFHIKAQGRARNDRGDSFLHPEGISHQSPGSRQRTLGLGWRAAVDPLPKVESEP